MRVLFLIVILMNVVSPLKAQDTIPAVTQDTIWRFGLKTGVNFTQTSFSENWAGGGVGSVALNGFLYGTALYKKDRITWRNELQLLYGVVNQEDQGTRKTIDRIFMDSKLGYELTPKWNMYSSLSLLTQFAPGYNFNADGSRDLISDFMAPAFITSSWGFEFVPNDWFWLRLGPFSPRLTIVNSDRIAQNVPENYGVPIGENVRTEWLAFQMTAEVDKNFGDNLNIKARYNLFANYETLEADKIDHFLEVIATSQVTKFLDVTFALNMIYDTDQVDDVQLSQLFGVGFLVKVGNLEIKE